MEISLSKKYKEIIVKNLKAKFEYKNIHQIPRIEKIIVSVGAGEAVQNHKILNFVENDLRMITGQKPLITKAKKSIAGFKLREGVSIGAKVTLRKEKMYHFLERLISVALPRVRDFKGISKKSFDSNGNYSLGIKEQLIFPEIEFDKTDKVRGLGITIITSAKNDEQSLFLLEEFGMPFRK